MLVSALPFPLEAAPLSNNESDKKTYAAVALQIAARSIEKAPDRAAARKQMLAMIPEIGAKLRSSVIFIQQYGGAPVKLAVLPEYVLTSYPGRISIPDFAEKAALEVDGPEYEALGKIAQEQKLFLSGNAYEADKNFPGIYFQTCFIIGPNGNVVLRYRRLNSMFAPTPHDVWSKYLDIYGLDGVFPVAKTEIGNLSAIASEEILYPEIARAHALRALTRRYGATLLINDDLPLCRLVGANGLHLGRDDGDLRVARAILGPDAILGASCYADPALAAAALAAALRDLPAPHPTR